tara:strand:- start:367 stop:639 length:273 start_codon:yes stop_codon:yes gene_type:complete
MFSIRDFFSKLAHLPLIFQRKSQSFPQYLLGLGLLVFAILILFSIGDYNVDQWMKVKLTIEVLIEFLIFIGALMLVLNNFYLDTIFKKKD